MPVDYTPRWRMGLDPSFVPQGDHPSLRGRRTTLGLSWSARGSMADDPDLKRILRASDKGKRQRVFHAVGVEVLASVRNNILRGRLQVVPNRPRTIVMKGHSVPLVSRLGETGPLISSLWEGGSGNVFEVSDHNVRVGSNHPHAVYAAEGTPPHAIPNAFGRGKNFGTAPDFHPGTPPRPFMVLYDEDKERIANTIVRTLFYED